MGLTARDRSPAARGVTLLTYWPSIDIAIESTLNSLRRCVRQAPRPAHGLDLHDAAPQGCRVAGPGRRIDCDGARAGELVLPGFQENRG
jgi:hypothetical protein